MGLRSPGGPRFDGDADRCQPPKPLRRIGAIDRFSRFRFPDFPLFQNGQIFGTRNIAIAKIASVSGAPTRTKSVKR